jgi:perosamine synthetase
MKIPVYQPSLSGNEKKYVNECLDSSWISSKGKFVTEFEQKFSEYLGINHSVTVSNGTVALHLALICLGIGEGDEVIVPTFTYIASVNSIVYTGAKPVFVDSNRNDWQMCTEDVVKKITPKTKAIMAVHLYGQPCDLKKLREIADKHSLFLIEDCAEAMGSKFESKYVGTYGDISTFSFFGNKTITTGEGGMVVTNDQTLFDRAVHYRGQGLAKHRQYWHDVVGYNYRMTNICAAIGLAQLERVEEILKKKRNVANFYIKNLAGTPLEHQKEVGNVYNSYWMFSVLASSYNEREELRVHLEKLGIETRPTFYPIHTMPMYSHKFQKHEIAEDLGWRGMNLPSWPELTEAELSYICDSIKSFYAK